MGPSAYTERLLQTAAPRKLASLPRLSVTYEKSLGNFFCSGAHAIANVTMYTQGKHDVYTFLAASTCADSLREIWPNSPIRQGSIGKVLCLCEQFLSFRGYHSAGCLNGTKRMHLIRSPWSQVRKLARSCTNSIEAIREANLVSLAPGFLWVLIQGLSTEHNQAINTMRLG